MQATNINVDGIEEALPAAFLNLKNQLIEEGLKKFNTWITPDPNVFEVINIFVYDKNYHRLKFPLNINEQRQLLDRMFDDNICSVYINKMRRVSTKSKFGITKVENITSEYENFIFSRLPMYLIQELHFIKEMISALRNPRVILTVEEHKIFVRRLSMFNINLSDYYI